MDNNKNLTTDALKRLLNQSANDIGAQTMEGLRLARMRALDSHRAQQHEPLSAWFNHHGLWVRGHGNEGHKDRLWAIALVFVACLLTGFIYLQNINEREHDHSDIDIAILTDDLPVDAYVE